MRVTQALSTALGVAAAVAVAASVSPASAGDVESSENCGSCHQTIYETWHESAHAHALDDEVFLQSLRDTESTRGRKLALLCLECHAPIVALNGDVDLALRITWEAVNCDVCHSLVSVDLSGKGPRRVLEPGPVKRGPFADAVDDAHPVAYSPLHTESAACAWCHEYTTPEGVPVLSTYSEWQKSEAAGRGETCQSCHMGATRVEVVDPRADRVPGAEINLHRVPGGHSLDQLHHALGVSIHTGREGDELTVDLTVRNKGAGHAVPTGMPGRKVILEVSVQGSSGESYSERRVYTRRFAASDGRPVVRDRDHFVPGARMVEDTRIAPDERREESFRFPVPPAATAYVKVNLHYEHSPLGGSEGRTWITFLSETRTVAPQRAAQGGSE